MIFFALSTNFWLSLALLTFSGMADNVSVVIRGTLVQTMTPEHLLGRVSAVNQIFIGSSNEIGAFESGVAAKLLGTVPSVVFGGAMTLIVVAITMWRSPALALSAMTGAMHGKRRPVPSVTRASDTRSPSEASSSPYRPEYRVQSSEF